MVRGFAGESALVDDDLGLALAPALTPTGLVPVPSFFHGFATRPQVLARGLVTLADITATRYFRPAPTNVRDPVLTAQGDRLRAECFSACNGVYARLDLLGDGFDAGEIGYGTTNVDITLATRQALTQVARDQLLHLDVGFEGLKVSSTDQTSHERPVQMPARWVPALGNAAAMHAGLVARVHLDATAARSFVAGLPSATGRSKSGWVTPTRTGAQISPRPSADAVHIEGLHRLSALKRLLTAIGGIWFHGPADGSPGAALVTVELPTARLVLGLTPETYRGYSGEGALLPALAGATVTEDADLVSVVLAFEPVIDVPRLAGSTGLTERRVADALAVLAASGRVGWDAHDQAWFHRELPADADRVDKDNPRLVAARKLVAEGAVEPWTGEPDVWAIRSGDTTYRVRLDPADDQTAMCTCTWYLRHGGGRGVCKHALAVQLTTQNQAEV
ncbi:MAG: SWIM zinc finger domain-containing protein [Micrococcales bacterium]|nr:SWIM zinc finger domain-containing protein [Micrococcales bacterium]